MIYNIDPARCTNCGACWQVCPTDAITVRDDTVFYSLQIDQTKCVDCGLCSKVCPAMHPVPERKPVAACSAIHTERRMIRESSSGGAFSALAEKILAAGGVVYGACYSEDFRRVVIRSTDHVPLSAMRRSKYVESCVEQTFTDVKKQLQNGRTVLYAAAPCQIAGLKAYLGQEYENLYCCDFTCGGFSSHAMYRTHLDALERKYGAPVTAVDFRSKELGWTSLSLDIRFRNGRRYLVPGELDPFYYGFAYRHLNVRDNCYQCRYTRNHQSDIILADFWKYRTASDLPRNESGISLLLANTPKGDRLIRSCSDVLEMTALDMEKASYNLKEKAYPAEFMDKRDRYISRFADTGTPESMECNSMSRIQKMIIRVKAAGKRFLRSVK